MTRRRQPTTTMTRTYDRLWAGCAVRSEWDIIPAASTTMTSCGYDVDYGQSRYTRVDNSREWGRCLFLRELSTSLDRSRALERFNSSQWQTAENRIMRPSQWSDLLITDSGSSLPLPTTKNRGDGRMRRHSRRLEVKTTRTCHWCGVFVCEDHSGVLMTCLQCAEGPGPSTVAALSAEAPNEWLTPDRELRRTILCHIVPLYIALYFLLCSEFQRNWYFNNCVSFFCS